MPKIVSLNVGLPRSIVYKGRQIVTSIFKEPVQGRLQLRKLNLDGDRQADLKVHGGLDKAVYAYPLEHYGFWRQQYPEMDLNPGMFGENFTTEGLSELQIRIGDRFRIGSAEVMVTQPRMPCYKLGAKFGRDDVLKKFLNSRRSGVYLSVITEGEVGDGDKIIAAGNHPDSITGSDVVELYLHPKANPQLLLKATQLESLPASWREYLAERLHR